MPSWKDLRRHLKKNGYTLLRHGSRDDWYEKTMPDGTNRRVRVSKSSGEIGKGLFENILKKQLGITKEEFNKKK